MLMNVSHSYHSDQCVDCSFDLKTWIKIKSSSLLVHSSIFKNKIKTDY